MTATLADPVRAHLRDCITQARISQAHIARTLGVSTKHLSQMLTGRAPISLDWAQDIAAVCGRELKISSRKARPSQSDTQETTRHA